MHHQKKRILAETAVQLWQSTREYPKQLSQKKTMYILMFIGGCLVWWSNNNAYGKTMEKECIVLVFSNDFAI